MTLRGGAVALPFARARAQRLDIPVIGLLSSLSRAASEERSCSPDDLLIAWKVRLATPGRPDTSLGKVLKSAKQDVLIVDPYMDETALSDFALLAPEKVSIRLLSDQHSVKSTLEPAYRRWSKQYGDTRPLTVKLAPARSLHDRVVILDGSGAYTLTQSLNAFAARAPASIVRIDAQTAALKVHAYQLIWDAAVAL